MTYGCAVSLKLAGLAEVAEILRVSKRTATRYAQRTDFPEPVARLRAGPIWLEDDVLAWARSKPQARPGRPLKAPEQV
jgi:predicted DNA-binding transcriptional regulator AlpA